MRVAWSILRRDSSCEVWQVRVVRQRKLSESRKGNKIKIISKAYYDVHVKQVPTFFGLYLYVLTSYNYITTHTVVQLTAGVDSTTGQSVAVKPLIGQLDCVPSFVCVHTVCGVRKGISNLVLYMCCCCCGLSRVAWHRKWEHPQAN